jgi:hypothetical protein
MKSGIIGAANNKTAEGNLLISSLRETITINPYRINNSINVKYSLLEIKNALIRQKVAI